MVSYRADIDGLRAVAILPVVFYHAGFPGMTGGYVGVDVFFVISAFLITSILAREIDGGTYYLLGFYERRARRILPALTVVLLATFAAATAVFLPDELDRLGKSAFATAFFLSNVHFASSLSYFSASAEYAPLLHTWSLAVEEQFYLLFPPLLYALLRLGGRRIALRALALVTLASLALAIVSLPRTPAATFFLLPGRAWELGLGAMLALLPASPELDATRRNLLAAAGLAAILLPVLVYDHATPFPGMAALPPVLGAAALIHVGRSGGSAVGRLLACRPMVGIGLISYSLYLWHWPLLALLRSARGEVALPLPLGLACAGLAVVLATLTYRLVEIPFRRRSPNTSGRAAIFSLSAASICLTAALGAVFALTDGLPRRLSPRTLEMAAVASDTNPRRGDCFNALPSEGLCRLGADGDGPVDFLFWGDSHADAMMPAVDLAARDAGLSGVFAGASACLPLPTLKRIPEARPCSEINDAVMAFLDARDDIGLVVLSGRWTLAVEGVRYGEEATEPVRLSLDGFHGSADNGYLVEAALTETIASIRATGRRVLLLGPVPEPGWNVPLLLAKNTMGFGRPLPPPLTRADYVARAGRTESILARVAAGDPGVTLRALSDLFCAETCPTTDADGIPLYSDDDHITYSTARRILPASLTTALIHAIP